MQLAIETIIIQRTDSRFTPLFRWHLYCDYLQREECNPNGMNMTHQFENHEYTRHQPSTRLLSNDRKEKHTKISVMKDILSSQTVVPPTIEYITAKIQICL